MNKRVCICDQGQEVYIYIYDPFYDIRQKKILICDQGVKRLVTYAVLCLCLLGSGLTAHTIVQRLCELSGIYDISANIVGSTNKLNIVRAWFEAVQKQRYGWC